MKLRNVAVAVGVLCGGAAFAQSQNPIKILTIISPGAGSHYGSQTAAQAAVTAEIQRMNTYIGNSGIGNTIYVDGGMIMSADTAYDRNNPAGARERAFGDQAAMSQRDYNGASMVIVVRRPTTNAGSAYGCVGPEYRCGVAAVDQRDLGDPKNAYQNAAARASGATHQTIPGVPELPGVDGSGRAFWIRTRNKCPQPGEGSPPPTGPGGNCDRAPVCYYTLGAVGFPPSSSPGTQPCGAAWKEPWAGDRLVCSKQEWCDDFGQHAPSVSYNPLKFGPTYYGKINTDSAGVQVSCNPIAWWTDTTPNRYASVTADAAIFSAYFMGPQNVQDDYNCSSWQALPQFSSATGTHSSGNPTGGPGFDAAGRIRDTSGQVSYNGVHPSRKLGPGAATRRQEQLLDKK